MLSGTVIAVSSSPAHTFSKPVQDVVQLIPGLGVEGDAHFGKTVQHLSRMARDPHQPNLRQVHLIQSELFDDLQGKGYSVSPGQMGENITTRDLDLLNLPTGTRLQIGESALIELTGLRNPCSQIDGLQKGLMAAVLDRDEQERIIRKAGVMAIVVTGGQVHPGDAITVELPPEPRHPLEPV